MNNGGRAVLLGALALVAATGVTPIGVAATAAALPPRPHSPVLPKPPERPGPEPRAAGRPQRHAIFLELEALEAHRRAAPVTILQIGDSHTANDAFSGRMRELFQQRFGDGGRGLLPAGIAFKTYNPTEVQVTASAGWVLINSFDSNTSGPFGLSGLRQHTDAAGETMTLTVAEPGGTTAAATPIQAAALAFGAQKDARPLAPPTGVQAGGADHATIELMRQPGGGRLEFLLDGKVRYTWSTDSPQRSVDWLGVAVPPGTRTIVIKTVDRSKPVDVLSWSLGRRGGGGVQWANHGTIGATVDLVGRWDPSVVTLEMRQLQPALITVAFGTNEGFQDGTNLDTYPSRYGLALNVLRAGAPGASLAIMGPPDGNRVVNGNTGNPTTCSPRVDPASTATQWTVPTKLPAIRAIQSQLAARNEAFFFDWSAAMGGACSMHRWTELQPPLGQPDHVHLRAAGYRQTAETMFREIMDDYDSWKASRRRR